MKAFLLLMLVLPPLLHASPLAMQQQTDNAQRLFSYQFRAAEQDIRFQFSLPVASIVRNSNLIKPYVPEVMQQQLWRELQQQAQQAGPYRIAPGPGRDWQNFQLLHAFPATSAQAEQANTQRLQLLQQLQQFSRQFQQQYLSNNGYQLQYLPDNRQQIIVDHLHIIEQSLPDVTPLAQSLVSQLNIQSQRQLLSVLLSWVQLIPLQPAEQADYGQSFSPPLQLLRQHHGDSASKTVLLATLVRSLLPDVKQALLYLPQRTVLALAIPAETDDRTVSLQGTDYLVADPSGPELMPAGTVAMSQQAFIVSQFFAYRLF
ncbi:hypothetical protein [Arsukibacterium indicum]|uniref:Uncharacterized protein n=1 Tax=Arsukibacterium indicum TaxID=2848612 RepID=A0ABS6MJQ6_9GAMM|nr:hypothetical protein [Arsukibacterium indicum]MBV2129043.1 hypothetical protein [Arsukibacterium indicum]